MTGLGIVKTWTRDEILDLIREELPALLEKDARLRYELMGMLLEAFPSRREFEETLSRIPTREEFEEALARVDRSLAAVERALEAFRAEMARLHAEQEALRQDVARLDGKIDTVREELTGQIETVREEVTGQIETVREELTGQIEATRGQIEAVREELTGQIETTREEFSTQLNQQISALEQAIRKEIVRLGQRWGLMSEDILRQVVRAIVQETYGGRVTELVIDGEQYDCVITDSEHILLEVTARATQKIIRRLERKRKRYAEHTGITPTRVILATAQIHYTVVERLRQMGIEVIQPDILIEDEEEPETEP